MDVDPKLGSFVTEIDGVRYYTDGIKHGGSSFSLTIGYISVSHDWNSISDTGAWKVVGTTQFPIVNVDSEGQVRAGGGRGPFDVGVVAYGDGTYGVYGGVNIGVPGLNIGYSMHGGGEHKAGNNLATYNHINVYTDGTVQRVEYSSGNAQYPHVKVTVTTIDKFGNAVGKPSFTNIADRNLAAQMAAGLAPHIHDQDRYFGRDHCFLPDTMIQMWPFDETIERLSDGTYDEVHVLSAAWQKRVNEIKVGDWVIAYDGAGRLAPSLVQGTMRNQVDHVLDFWGTGTTPGHAFLCAEGSLAGQHVPLIEILRNDGAIMRADGTIIRASTNCEVGSLGDKMIHVSALVRQEDGLWTESQQGSLRFGTRVILDDGCDVSLMEIASRQGWHVSSDGYMIDKIVGKDGMIQGKKFGFPLLNSQTLPGPEDYLLARSGVTLEAIYGSSEMETVEDRRLVTRWDEKAIEVPRNLFGATLNNSDDSVSKIWI